MKRGYNCEVFCRRSSYAKELDEYEGRKLVYVNGSKSRMLDTFVSSFQTGWHLIRNRKRYLFVFWHNNANCPGVMMTLLARIPMAINTNGLEWRREKWSLPFKLYYYVSTWLIALFCDKLVSDSIEIRRFYKEHFNVKSHYIPYGVRPAAGIMDARAKEILDDLGLTEGKFFSQVTRIEPDNLPYEAAVGFVDSGLWRDGFKMVVVGYKEPHPYATKLKALDGNSGVIVMDACYDQDVLAALRTKCFAYVHGNHAGGTNPALLEAMLSCPRIMAIDVNYSREVLGETAHFFDPSKIAAAYHAILSYRDCSEELRTRLHKYYRWDEVAEAYMRLSENKDADYKPRQEL